MFEGVERVELSQDEKAQVVAILSREQERVQMLQQIVTKGALPERWLRSLEMNLKSTLKDRIVEAYQDLLQPGTKFSEWVNSYHGQVASTVSGIWFSERL